MWYVIYYGNLQLTWDTWDIWKQIIENIEYKVYRAKL